MITIPALTKMMPLRTIPPLNILDTTSNNAGIVLHLDAELNHMPERYLKKTFILRTFIRKDLILETKEVKKNTKMSLFFISLLRGGREWNKVNSDFFFIEALNF